MTNQGRCDCGDTECVWCGTAQGTYHAPESPDGPDVDATEGDELEAEWNAHEELIDGVGFADPGGRSALRAATKRNPRNLPCPNCGRPDMLTPADQARGYQCDICADQAERGGY